MAFHRVEASQLKYFAILVTFEPFREFQGFLREILHFVGI